MEHIEYHEMCPEMLKLREQLDKLNIDWADASDPVSEHRILLNSHHIYRTHFDYKGDEYSVIYGFGTYGGWGRFPDVGDPQLLELMINDDIPTGWPTADDIIKIMKSDKLRGERKK